MLHYYIFNITLQDVCSIKQIILEKIVFNLCLCYKFITTKNYFIHKVDYLHKNEIITESLILI